MFKTVAIGHTCVILSAAKNLPVYKREREVTRAKFLKSTPHRLRMTIGYRSILKHPTYCTAFRRAMAA
jgi:hypothetical protein